MANHTLWISSLLFSVIILALCSPHYPTVSNVFWLQRFTNNVVSKASERQRVLLLTAHPDDECMFFAPTVLALTQGTHNLNQENPKATHGSSKARTDVYSLCLSSGNADGLGDTRKRELEKSFEVLGVERGRRWVLDEPFEDNITMFWDAELVAEHVRPYILEHSIDAVLTFDAHGVSSHPNHISLERGARALLANAPRTGLRAFSLKTTALLPKYAGLGAALLAKVDLALCSALPQLQNIPLLERISPVLAAVRIAVCPSDDGSAPPTFVSGWAGYAHALRAMRAHRSQLVWFRWLYVAFSRYMWVNTWDEIVLENASDAGLGYPSPLH